MSRVALLLSFIVSLVATAPGSAAESKPQSFGYLFAHMTKEDYGRLYYSVSLDGLNWTVLNGRHRILDDYRGHPGITRGGDGRYYLTGNTETGPDIRIWVSRDLIGWEVLTTFLPDFSNFPNVPSPGGYHGAPKLFFDTAQQRYVITWHSSTETRETHHPWVYWNNMRTYYITSPDLKTFTAAQRLLPFDIATIDTILVRSGDRYYAILKDEHYPDFTYPGGKAIRVSSAPDLTGPWTDPTPSFTPNFCEAPTVIARPDGMGWYLYADRYVPHQMYECFTAPALTGPWIVVKADMTPDAKHGGMIAIPKIEYDAVVAAFAATNP